MKCVSWGTCVETDMVFDNLVRVMRPDRTEAHYGEMGRIVIKLPLPPGTMSTLFKSPDRFVKTYFSEYPVSLSTESLSLLSLR
jgi:acyl-coenzyme A synthetase/AMP-(fatty) acid ligase